LGHSIYYTNYVLDKYYKKYLKWDMVSALDVVVLKIWKIMGISPSIQLA